jgi:hypothetical protein
VAALAKRNLIYFRRQRPGCLAKALILTVPPSGLQQISSPAPYLAIPPAQTPTHRLLLSTPCPQSPYLPGLEVPGKVLSSDNNIMSHASQREGAKSPPSYKEEPAPVAVDVSEAPCHSDPSFITFSDSHRSRRCCSIYILPASSCLQPFSYPLTYSRSTTHRNLLSLQLQERDKHTKAVAALLLFAYASALCTSLCARRRITGHLVTPVQARLWLHGMPSSLPSAIPSLHMPPLPCPNTHHSTKGGHDFTTTSHA